MDLHDFICRRVNIVDLGEGLTLGRETAKNIDFMTITFGNETVFSWWSNPNKKASNKPPKHTGGKPSYVKQFLKEVRKHKNLSIEAAGFIQKMLDNINWGDNLLIDQRSKKALKLKDICEAIGKSKPFTQRIIKELIEAEILNKDKYGYKISPSLIQKGNKR